MQVIEHRLSRAAPRHAWAWTRVSAHDTKLTARDVLAGKENTPAKKQRRGTYTGLRAALHRSHAENGGSFPHHPAPSAPYRRKERQRALTAERVSVLAFSTHVARLVKGACALLGEHIRSPSPFPAHLQEKTSPQTPSPNGQNGAEFAGTLLAQRVEKEEGRELTDEEEEALLSAVVAPALRDAVSVGVLRAVARYSDSVDAVAANSTREIPTTQLPAASSNAGNVWKATVFVVGSCQDLKMFTHVGPMDPHPVSAHVEVRGDPRKNPAIKDAAWVRERQRYERLKAEGVNEVLLCDWKHGPSKAGSDVGGLKGPKGSEEAASELPSGRLTEGMLSNFFAIDASGTKVVTCPEGGVLAGTIRSLVLEACADHGVPVVLEPPPLEDLPAWSGAAIASTSRLLLPIHRMDVIPPMGATAGQITYRRDFPVDPLPPLLAQLVRWTEEKIGAHSEDMAILASDDPGLLAAQDPVDLRASLESLGEG
jgi:Amino-transferase class IV